MLRIPVAGEPTPLLVAKSALKIVPVSLPESFQRSREKGEEETPAAAPIAREQGMVKRRRRETRADDDEPDWEKSREQRVRVGGRRKFRWGRTFAVALAVLSGVAGLIILTRREKEPVTEPIAVAPIPEAPSAGSPEMENIDLPLEMSRNETELLGELQPLSRKFLEAKSVDEMLPLVRDRRRVEPEMRAFYPGGVIPAPGLGQFNTLGAVAYRGKLASVGVRTGDFEMKQLAFIRTEEGLKVDWESYVGWSEMPWKDFVETKPEKPVLFRVVARDVEYYNFDYSDDVEWRSFQLGSPDGEQAVYGYAKRNSPAEEALRPARKGETALVTLKLKYPAGAKQKNQVLVDSIVADGWVVGAEGD